MSVHGEPVKRTTVLTFQDKKQRGEPLTELTAYDHPTAVAVDEAGVDAILVGDSLAMVVLGYPNTLSVTMDEMLHHARAVSRGGRRALLIGDLPFMSYQADPAEALRNAGRYLQEAGMDAVKLEGGRAYASTAAAMVRAGIPVQGHLGLTPQSVNTLGGFKVQGRTADAARRLLDDALMLEDAGCFSVVLECVPEPVARLITERLHIPTIGIGAGRGTSGQVLVTQDLLGLVASPPKFAPRYAEIGTDTAKALQAYLKDVSAHVFPAEQHTFRMPEEEWHAFLASVGARLPEPEPSCS
jgi:3-methyl-2-oxobutanoate hydroxymethyltransferase